MANRSPPYSISSPSTVLSSSPLSMMSSPIVVEFGERPGVGDVELGERDGAVLADLLRRVVRRRDRDVLDLLDVGEQLLHRRLHLGVGDPLRCLEHDLGREAGAVGRVRLEQLLHLLGLAGGKREVGAVVGADGTGDAVDDDQQCDPRTDHDPTMADADAGDPLQRARAVRADASRLAVCLRTWGCLLVRSASAGRTINVGTPSTLSTPDFRHVPVRRPSRSCIGARHRCTTFDAVGQRPAMRASLRSTRRQESRPIVVGRRVDAVHGDPRRAGERMAHRPQAACERALAGLALAPG